MGGYAALVSLNHTIEQIQHHPRPPISLDEEQVNSLTKTVTYLQGFLEGFEVLHGREADGLESRIADAANAAEDMIESHVVDQINHEERTSSIDFDRGLKEMIDEMDSIKNKVLEIIEEKRGFRNLHKNSAASSPRSSRATSVLQTNTIVGFDDLITEALDKLTGGDSDLRIIRVVGMGGIGKTTLAQSVYENGMIVDHFDIRVWVTISQEYRMSEILLQLLQDDGGNLSHMDEYELGVELFQQLSARRYLIIMDDIWDNEVWEQLKLDFPDNKNGSRVVITTRHSNVASFEANSHTIKMHFLDNSNSWNLFSKIVFGKKDCPQQMEEIGRKIAESCKGLPLSINVIGGLLAKSTQTEQHWEYVAENFNSIVNLEDGEYCLQILYMSYNSLPVYLRPCFLYMGVFGENTILHVSKLIKLWDAEGLLKPDPERCWEEVAQKYLGELVDRNLILVEKRNYDHGKLKSCRIHHLLRDLCLREARKQKFFCALGVHSLNTPQDLLYERRICIQERRRNAVYLAEIFNSLNSSALARTLIWEHEQPHLPPLFRLLRVYVADISHQTHLLRVVFQRVNLRYINIQVDYYDFSLGFPFSFSFLWNLRTLILRSRSSLSMPSEIWKMPQLKDVQIWEVVQLPDPPSDAIVLTNLRELLHISNFKCSNAVVDIIPNIKRLKVSYGEECVKGVPADCCLNNLGRLHKLESLGLRLYYDPRNAATHLLHRLSLPDSLTNLSLEYTFLQWGDMTVKIGSLPLLQVLKLKYESFVGPEWETVEGQFVRLKFLVIERCHDLKLWITDSAHFPALEHLVLRGLQELTEIPKEIGEIATLKSIQLVNCSESAVYSAIMIRQEQEEYGNEIQVHIPAEEEEEIMDIIEEEKDIN